MSALGNELPTRQETLHLESRFGALLDAVPDAIVIADSENRIVLVNKTAERLFGHAKRELLGKPVEVLLPKRFRTAAPGQTGGYFTQPPAGSTGTPSELSGLRQDGREFPIEIFCQPLQTEAGLCVVIAIRDVTERKCLQKELCDKSAYLEIATQEFHAFSHSISHDLRAPLRAMDGFAAMLKRSLGEGLSKDTEHLLNRIQENVSKMSSLIEGLLDHATLSWVALTKKKIDPARIAQKSFDDLSPSLAGRRVDFAVGKLPACEAYLALLRRLFDNLLSNALKYTRKQNPAVIRVGCRDQNGDRVYFVQDNGVGFDMEYSDKLFHVFQRLHSPSEFEGTGMGLAIVQRIVQRHGGRVWAEAQVDHGATFYFTMGNSGNEHSA